MKNPEKIYVSIIQSCGTILKYVYQNYYKLPDFIPEFN